MAPPVRVLELRSARGSGGGPEKTILLGAARTNIEHIAVTVCYLRDLRDTTFVIGDRARSLGVHYVEILERHSFDPRVWPALRQVVRDHQIDIVHTHEYKTNALGLLLARAEGIIPMATVHGWIENTARERLYGFFDRRVLARYPLIVAVSEEIRSTLIAHGAPPGRVRRLLNGVDPAHFARRGDHLQARRQLNVPPGLPIIGSVGRLGPEKRFDVLLAAAAQLDLRPVVVIAGEGPCRSELLQFAAHHGVDLRLPGHCDDVRTVYEALDVFVQSSDTEGVPNAVLEAMAMRVPVVATDVGGTREIVRDGVDGVIVPRRDPDGLAGAIGAALRQPELSGARAQAARGRVEEELSFDVRMDALDRLYEELATSRRAATIASAQATRERLRHIPMRPPTSSK
jgi:glycosyltransferase involved in cell wall biosynthesis